MSSEPAAGANVRQAVPFFGVVSMERSLRFYVEGLGFTMTLRWMDEGKLRWCWLERGGAALMLQEYRPEFVPQTKLGAGVSVCFICDDAMVDDVMSAGSALRGTYAELREHGAEPVAAGALMVLGSAGAGFFADRGVPVEAVCRDHYELWLPADCPLCRAGMPLEDVA